MSGYTLPDYMQQVTVIVSVWHSDNTLEDMTAIIHQALEPLEDYQLPYVRYHNLDRYIQDIVIFKELTETELFMIELKLAGRILRVYTEEWNK